MNTYAKALAGLAFIFATLWLIVRSGALSSIGAAFQQLESLEIVIIGLLFAGMRIGQAISLSLAIRMQGVPLQFSQSLELSALKGFFNLGFIGAGVAAQAMQARTDKLFTLKHLALATAFLAVLLVSFQGILLVIFAFLFGKAGGYKLIMAGVGIVAALCPMLILLLLRFTSIAHRILPTKLYALTEDIRGSLRRANVGYVGRVWLAQGALVVFRIGRVIFVAYALDPQAALGLLLTITIFADLVTAIPLTPGGIGLREFIIGLGGELAGHFDLFIAVAVIDRAITLGGNLVHGLYVSGTRVLKTP